MTTTTKTTRVWSLVLANLLIPVSIVLFATGFFPYKPFLAGLATFEEVETEEHGLGLGLVGKETRPERVFDKVVFMVVDALRSDFVYARDSGFVFTQSLIRTGAAMPFTAHAAPPTVTMPRVKGLTSGSVPSFLDLILNFAESDTSSSLAAQDTWLAQIKAHLSTEDGGEGKLVFYGDDTWLKLFPDFFARTDGTTSFFVSDFTEVDNNVTRHVPDELNQPDWNAMIMHYLGLDHIGHKSGPLSPNMLPKQREMDGIVETIYEAIDTLPHLQNTLLVLAGDHGMNAGGNHGGSAAGETSPALVFVSPKLRQITCDAELTAKESLEVQKPTSAATFFAAEQRQKMDKIKSGTAQENLAAYLTQIWNEMSPDDKTIYESLAFRDRMRYEEDMEKACCKSPVHHKAPTQPKQGTEFDYYRRVEQSDLVPTLAALLGIPVSRNNLGIIIPEMLKFWSGSQSSSHKLPSDQQLLYRNALQILTILKAAYGDAAFDNALDFPADYDLMKEKDACRALPEGAEELSCKWRLVKYSLSKGTVDGSVLIDFLATAQDTLSATASSYNVTNLVAGTAVAVLATIFAIYSKRTLAHPTTAGIAFTAIIILHGVMMFASSYVEEEQHFWYWITSAWIVCLYFTRPTSNIDIKSSSFPSKRRAAIATIVLLASHRLMTRWNQTGQKFAGAPDIAHDFFAAHHILLWIAVLITYFHLSIRFARRTFSNLASNELAAMTALSLTVPSLVFKLNFTQADAPELVQDLAKTIREITADWDLVIQARATFMGIGMAVVAVLVLMSLRGKWLGENDVARDVSLAQRIHDLLTIFLITQTRVQNIPLFLVFEIQLQLLYILLSPAVFPSSTTKTDEKESSDISSSSSSSSVFSRRNKISTLPITISILLFTYTSYFAFGGSNAISSIDLGNAYNGISDYNIFAVGVLLFASNWAGPIWWGGAAILLISRIKDITNNSSSTGFTKTEGEEGVDEILTEDDKWNLLSTAEKEEVMKKNEEKAKKEKRRKWINEEMELLNRAPLSASSASSSESSSSQPKESTPPSLTSQSNTPATTTKTKTKNNKDNKWTTHISTLTIFLTADLVAVMSACTILRTHLFIWTVFSPKFLYAVAWGLGWHLIVNVGVWGVVGFVW